MANRRQTIEQQRGQQAWVDIRSIINANKKDTEREYRSLVRGLTSMIQVNGLGQTLGYLYAKQDRRGKNAHFHLLNHLTYWLHNHFDSAISNTNNEQENGLLEWLTQTATSNDYRRASAECISYCNWLRRFAEAELEDPNSKGQQNEQQNEQQ